MTRSRWTAVALVALLSVLLNSCSSGTTGPPPTPAITTISPDGLVAGSAGFTLFISGSGFIKTSVGFWDGTMRATKFNATTGELEVSITAADVADQGASVQVTVVNPDPGGTSNAITFIVNPVANGAPKITSFNPPNAMAGTAGPFVVSVAGTGFVPTSVVNWNGSTRLTTFVSASQLMVSFTTQDLAAPGAGSVSASNPAPDGGVSPSVEFPVN
ncbi:MAG: hypothetical protein ACRD59_16580 [Candidatus Acidiferrales bacterium]